MSLLMKSMMILSELCKKADVVGGVRISITFDDPRDKAYFEAEVKREADQHNLGYRTGAWDVLGEATMYGIKVRIR